MAYFQMDDNPKKELEVKDDFEKYALSAYKSATEYWQAAVILLPHLVECSVPIISTVAFACELYLKAILAFTSKATTEKQLRGHSLDVLFNKIDNKEIQQRIVDDSGETNFNRALKEVGKAFQVSRYVHEYKGMACNVQFLYMFMNALHNECMRLMKERDNE